jgi:TPR repeat protein
MKTAPVFLLLASTALAVSAQTIAISATDGFKSHYVVSPANGDPTARTADEINSLNLKLAASGNTEADFELGLAYMQGVGVGQDLAKAEHYFEIGAIKPSDKELVSGFYLEHGWFPYSPEKAVGWLLAAGRSFDLFEAAQTYRKFSPPQEAKAAEMYRALLKQPEAPEYRRAQMELGNLVLDGKYSAGDDPAGHALNLEWARIVTQELIGQEEYTIAVAYSAQADSVPKDDAMWLRYCKRAAAYNIDLAQQFYGNAILQGEIKNRSPFEGYAWIRLASDKQFSNKTSVAHLEAQMSPDQLSEANSVFQGLVQTRAHDGAYYSFDDPLREPSVAELQALPDDDPDVQLRRAFTLESSTRPEDYDQALRLYRIARDRRWMDVKVVLGRDYLYGTHGVAKDVRLSKYWLTRAAEAGSKPAALYLAKWYSGEGGGNPDAIQALTWDLIGHESPTVVIPPANLSVAEKLTAMEAYAAWLTTHPGWSTPPSAQ